MIRSTRSAGWRTTLERRSARVEQPAVAAHLHHRPAAAEPQVVDPRVGRVDEAEPVEPPLDAHPRGDRAVDEDRVAEEPDVHVLGVAQRPVAVEGVVREHDRHVVLPAREVEPRVAVVLEHVGADEPVVERPRGAAVGVVVVPERRAVLLVRIGVVERAAGRDHVHRMAVALRRHVAAVEVDVAVEREPVARPHDRRPALAGADRRAGVDPVVAVDRRLHAGQDLGEALADVEVEDVDAVLDRDRRGLGHDRQVALERREDRLGERAPPGGGLQLPAADRARAPEGAHERDGAEAVAHEVAPRPRVGGRAERVRRRAHPRAFPTRRRARSVATLPPLSRARELDDVAAALQPAAPHGERAPPGAHLQAGGADDLARLAPLDAHGDRRGLRQREGDAHAAPVRVEADARDRGRDAVARGGAGRRRRGAGRRTASGSRRAAASSGAAWSSAPGSGCRPAASGWG